MRLKTQLAIKADIEALPPRAWGRKDFQVYLKERRQHWNAPQYLNTTGLIDFLLENEIARTEEIHSSEYGKKSRYVTGYLSPFEFALSFFKHSYLSHGTALHLHGHAPEGKIFVNHEQTAKKSTSRLSQRGIDQAFRNQPRRSAFEFKTKTSSITFLNGKNTGNAGVIDFVGPNGERLRTTSLERTLIDCVVRPQYAGGIAKVAAVFLTACDHVSIPEIAQLLAKTKYAYPYHQAIGFLLERAGVNRDKLAPLRKNSIRFNFHLDYGVKESGFDDAWKIHYPLHLGIPSSGSTPEQRSAVSIN